MTVTDDLLGTGADLAGLSRDLYRRGWMEGTAGNLSVRLPHPAGHALITASGRGKGGPTEADLVGVNISDGSPLTAGSPRPSAETAIHTALYRCFPDCGAVVHAHPPYSTVLAWKAARDSDPAGSGVREIRFRDFELIKGLAVADPAEVGVPVFANLPDVAGIGDEVAAHFATAGPDAPAVLLIADHGATAWGPNLETARNRLECLEALCKLHLLTLRFDEETR